MQLVANETSVVTKFGSTAPTQPIWCASIGGADNQEDLSISRRFGALSCNALEDFDVNSPVVFTNSKQNGLQNSASWTKELKGAAANYSKVWIYDHPSNVGRLESFDVSCLEDGAWKTVLDNADQQFVDHAAKHRPSLWTSFEFSEACTSRSWMMSNMNGGPVDTHHNTLKTPSIYVFEVALGSDDAEPALAPVKPAKIQGWCTKQQEWTIPCSKRDQQTPGQTPVCKRYPPLSTGVD